MATVETLKMIQAVSMKMTQMGRKQRGCLRRKTQKIDLVRLVAFEPVALDFLVRKETACVRTSTAVHIGCYLPLE